ncbi:MAG: hypothetical protein JSU69_03005 [Candidatus Zixiibacteriota bacterium]|nr:MAG: hypothetical protein JSU69_03005 [candidate division Zixibacteria bacterium]
MRLNKYSLAIVLPAIFLIGGLPGSGKDLVEKYRPKDSRREYILYLNDIEIGRMESELHGEANFEGVAAYRFNESLELDYSLIGREYLLRIDNKHYVNGNGFYLGDDMKLTMNDQQQDLFLRAFGDSVTGYSASGDLKEEIWLYLGGDFFSADNYMLDQYELLLAARDLRVGDTIVDSVFIPQAMITAPVRIMVEESRWVKYGKLYDSVYVCRFTEPLEQTAYITGKGKLVRLDRKAEGLKAVLQESPLDRMTPVEKSFSLADFIKRFPMYFAYLVFGLIFAAPFLKRFYRKPELYVALVLGGAMFPLLKLTQFPVQRWYTEAFFIPGMESGGSLYFYAVFVALISGIFQETLKLTPIALFCYWRKPTQLLSIGIGVLCGVGFGIYGACSLAGAMKFISWGSFEQVITILFHGVAGAAVGYGINRGLKHLGVIWLSLIIIHTAANYLVVFVQKKLIDAAILELLLTLIYLILILIIYMIIKKARTRIPSKLPKS